MGLIFAQGTMVALLERFARAHLAKESAGRG